jgi:hypothetical protein
MYSRSAGILGVFLLLVASPASASHFVFDCPQDRYLSVAVGQAHQFASPIQAVSPGNDRVQVTFQPHLPAGWSAHWELRSTGQSFDSDGQVDLIVGLHDRIDVSITPAPGVSGYGWTDLTIRSTEDPYEIARCTYTLFSGLPVPAVDPTAHPGRPQRPVVIGVLLATLGEIRRRGRLFLGAGATSGTHAH